jgi:hypothetical protein
VKGTDAAQSASVFDELIGSLTQMALSYGKGAASQQAIPGGQVITYSHRLGYLQAVLRAQLKGGRIRGLTYTVSLRARSHAISDYSFSDVVGNYGGGPPVTAPAPSEVTSTALGDRPIPPSCHLGKS